MNIATPTYQLAIGLVTTCRRTLAVCLCLMALAVGQAYALDQVSIQATVPVGYEGSLTPAVLTVTRSGSINALTVNYTVGGTATPGVDYAALSGSVSFGISETSKTITVTPIHNFAITGRLTVLLNLTPSGAYNIFPNSAGQVDITDSDLTASVVVPVPLAHKDPALFGTVLDPDANRRGVSRVIFSPAPPTIVRNVDVRFGGTAIAGTDYNVTYKVGGNSLGKGLGYSAVAYPRTTSLIFIDGATTTIPTNSSITFSDSPNIVYTVTNGAPGFAGPGLISISPGLLANLHNGAAVTVVGSTVSGYVVDHPYAQGATSITVEGGVGGIVVGDVMTFEGIKGNYVATSNMNGLGQFNFRAFSGGGFAGGLATPIAGNVTMSTVFTATITPSQPQSLVLIPPESSMVEFAINPVETGKPTGAQLVIMTLLADEDYALINPTVGTVSIADDVVSVDVALGSNASKPSTSGFFQVSLTQPFPVAVNVPYAISGTAVPGFDYVALSGSLVIPAGATTGVIQVNPLNTNTVTPGGTTVTVTLLNSSDYKLLATSSSQANPSATVNIADSQGSVGIVATTPLAYESPTAPINGQFTVTLNAINPGGNNPISVNYTVSGTATPGTDYVPLNGSVIIGAGLSSATIDVTPIDNLVYTGDLSVVVTLAGGQGYSIGTISASAQVVIKDVEPVISVGRVSDASEPSTNGAFIVSYSGVPAGTPLNRPVTVPYTFSGTATAGVRFTNSSSVTIPAGTLSAQIPINVIDDTIVEPPQTVIISLAPGSAYGVGISTATLTIFDNEPTISVVTTASAASPSTNGTFTVSYPGPAVPQSVSVSYTIAGSALAGSRYQVLPGTVTIPGGSTSAVITVVPIANAVPVGNQTVSVTLGPSTSYNLGATNSATMTILDNLVGVISVSSSNSDGTYLVNATIHVLVQFSVPVTVVTIGGTPTLSLAVGATPRVATYTSGSGTSTLVFNYNVNLGDTSPDLDYTATSALSLNGATIAAGATNAVLTLPAPGQLGSLGANKALVVNGVADLNQKPTPGVIVTGGKSGCGSGSGFAALALLGLLITRLGLRSDRSRN